MDSDNEDREEENPSWKGVSGTVLLINMYDPLQTNTPKQAYDATCELLKGYMREASSQLIGVCLYGTSTQCDAGIEGIRQVMPLTVADLDNFNTIRTINIDSCQQTKDLKLSDALWHANKMFANCKKLLSSKNVIILTRADLAPVESDQKPTLKRVRDLVDASVQMQIVNISETVYHVDKFYNTFLTEANKGNSEFQVSDPVWGVVDIVKQMKRHSHRHLAIARLSLEIGEGLSVGVGLYNLLKSNIKPKKVITEKETNQILTRQNYVWKKSYGEEEDAEGGGGSADVPLLKSEMFLYQTLGGERVLFTAEESKQMRNPFGPPMLKLLGFKPASILCKEKWYVSPCYLLYPNESVIEGSTIAFNALHQACTEMSVVAICIMCTRVNARPKIIGLAPCTQPMGLDDIKVAFDVITLPFAENVRNLQPEESEVEYTDPQKQVVKDILEELRFDYKPDMFENPHVQLLTRAIEALAFEEEDYEPYKDTTLQDDERYRKIDAELFDEIFGSLVEKRRAAQSKSGVPEKKQKNGDENDEELLTTRIQTKQVEKFTVKQLRDILSANNIKYTMQMNKPALCKLVYEYCK